LLSIDRTAKIFVQTSGMEEDFNEPQDIFPSDIGEETDFTQPTFLIGDNGELVPSTKLFDDDSFVYYCWWD